MAQVLRKEFFAFANDFTTFVVRYPFHVSIIIPIEYLHSVHEFVAASAVLRAVFRFNVRSFFVWALGFHPKAVTHHHAFCNEFVIAAT
jgi:hypothetical protein